MTGGLLNVLKPPGMTSHDVVSFIRKTYGMKRVGHGGTLDPGAAGVLPVALGQATRLIEYITAADKSYRVELTFGYETDTGDDTGKVIHTADYDMPAPEQLQDVLQSFTGINRQIPPMHSAIKVNGKKLYELARAGISIDRPAREIEISRITLLKVFPTGILFDVTCSKGTYIRSLCRDLGTKLGCPAVMSFLVRTRVGKFLLSDALTVEELALKPELLLADPFLCLPKVSLSHDKAQAFTYGKSIFCEELCETLYGVYDEQKSFLGIGKKSACASVLIPVKVLSCQGKTLL
ncbi:MAG: tRNA pseudouridine(55) synthase TruB [Veillonellales bacterium]